MWSWDDLPELPPELIFLPRWFPLNIYDWGCWARQTIVPLTIVSSLKPVAAGRFGIDELRTGSTRPRKGAPWTLVRLLPAPRPGCCTSIRGIRSGRCAGSRCAAPPSGSSPARRPTGAGAASSRRGSTRSWRCTCSATRSTIPRSRAGLAGLDGFLIREQTPTGSVRRLEACQSPVWDTGLALIALLDAGVPGDDPAVLRAADWLLQRGDPGHRRLGGPPAATWRRAAGRSSSPTTATPTSTTPPRSCSACAASPTRSRRAVRAAVERGVAWTVGMQSRRRRLGRVRRRQHPSAREQAAVLRLRRGDRPAVGRRHRARRRDAGARGHRRQTAGRRGVAWLLGTRSRTDRGSAAGAPTTSTAPAPSSRPWSRPASTPPSRADPARRRAGWSSTRTPTAAGARTCAPTATRPGPAGARRPRRRPRGRCWRCSRPATRSAAVRPWRRVPGRHPARRRRLGRRPVHRHRLPRRLLHQLRHVPVGVPDQRPRPLRRRRSCDRHARRPSPAVCAPLAAERFALRDMPRPTVVRTGMGPARSTRAASPTLAGRPIARRRRRRRARPDVAARRRRRRDRGPRPRRRTGAVPVRAAARGRAAAPRPDRAHRPDRSAAAHGAGAARTRAGRHRSAGRRHGVAHGWRRPAASRSPWSGPSSTPPTRRCSTRARWSAGVAALRNLAPGRAGDRRWAAAARPARGAAGQPRSFCAGVERAIDIVERALERYAPRSTCAARSCTTPTSSGPRAARRRLRRRGRRGADRATSGARRARRRPAVRAEAAARELRVIDATCPLVAKVHTEVRRFAGRGDTVLLIGHADHEEVEGTLGEAPDEIVVIPDVAAAMTVTPRDPRPGRVRDADHARRRRGRGDRRRAARPVPDARGPAPRRHLLRDDQPPAGGAGHRRRVRPGARRRLGELLQLAAAGRGRRSGKACRRTWSTTRARSTCAWLAAATRIGITAGASAPPHLVDELVRCLGGLGTGDGHRSRRRNRRPSVHIAQGGELNDGNATAPERSARQLPDAAEAACATRSSRCSSSSNRCSRATSSASAAARSSSRPRCSSSGCRSSRRSARSRRAARRWCRSPAASR